MKTNLKGVTIMNGSGLLTNGEHDKLWREAFTKVPTIAMSLRRANGIACVKGLHEVGELTDEEYVSCLKVILREEGFDLER